MGRTAGVIIDGVQTAQGRYNWQGEATRSLSTDNVFSSTSRTKILGIDNVCFKLAKERIVTEVDWF